jgi:hypothetical protein
MAAARLTELMSDRPTSIVMAGEHYRYVTDRYILNGIGGLRLGEATVAGVDTLLKAISTHSGASAAKSTKSVLSSMLGMAVRRGAISVNPVRDVERVVRQRKPVRSLTVQEAMRWSYR